jgi:hypothetical protein
MTVVIPERQEARLRGTLEESIDAMIAGKRGGGLDVGRFSDEDWAKAKRLCRLSPDEVRMARRLGLNPRKLPQHVPSPSQRWKLPVGEWVRELHSRSFGAPRDEAAVPPRAPRKPAPPPDTAPFDDGLDPFEDAAAWLDRDPTEAELQEEDHFRLRHRESFRAAAEYVAAAFAALGFVHRVVLFGSVARPPERETPRQWRYRRTGAQLWHEIKDVDLAVWVSEVSGLKALQKARGRALNDLLADRNMGVAHHQADVFLFEPGTDRYLGRLCHFGVCPKHKPECRVAGCGASLFLRQHEHFAFDPRALGRGTVVLFDRAMGVAAPDPTRDDDVPF